MQPDDGENDTLDLGPKTVRNSSARGKEGKRGGKNAAQSRIGCGEGAEKKNGLSLVEIAGNAPNGEKRGPVERDRSSHKKRSSSGMGA